MKTKVKSSRCNKAVIVSVGCFLLVCRAEPCNYKLTSRNPLKIENLYVVAVY
jgi:hypothetical protein